jgi:hypothetical protein
MSHVMQFVAFLIMHTHLALLLTVTHGEPVKCKPLAIKMDDQEKKERERERHRH